MVVALYIYTETDTAPRRIELFNDEKISITSSIQNVNDISKVFTDFSQSFTIPATDANNATFKHWYENALDNGFDQRLRYDGYIEIDTAVFRTGRWQIEGASVKNNRVENYKITFYGILKSLKDKFGEDKLINVTTINQYSFNYTKENVIDLVENPISLGLAFPLISSKRVWQIGGGGVNDINSGSHGINPSELFPAIKLSTLFYAIGEKYGVSFTGNFLTQNRFNEAYLWLKNKDVFTQRLNAATITNTIAIAPISAPNYSRKLFANVTVGAGVGFILKVYKDFLPFAEINGTGTTSVDIFYQASASINNLYIGNYTFAIQLFEAGTVSIAFTERKYFYSSGTSSQTDTTVNTGTLTTNPVLELTSLMPDMKVADFFSGILKMFNLTAFSKNENTYLIEQLEKWYESGEIKDFTEYTFTDLEFERLKAYKKIDFKYQKSESLINRNFNAAYAREYGDLSYTFSNDGADYTIELPFENLQFSNIDNGDLNVGYSLQSAPEYKPYIPKPIILYYYGNINGSFRMNGTSGHVQLNKYNAFGQDVIYNGELNTLNFGIENSLYSNNTVSNTLFNNYYFSYLNNLYSLKSRMIKVSMRLPFIKLINLKLNDRIVIRDKRYIINQYTTDLDTFESKFELVQDFRSVLANNNLSFRFNSDMQTVVLDYIPFDGLTWGVRADPFNQVNSISYTSDKITIGLNKNNEGVDIVCYLESSNNDLIYITQDA